MRKWLGMALAGLVALACAASAQAETKYALCVGINKYTLSGCQDLSGCVNDSAYFYTNLVERGGWLPANMTRLNDSKATKANIRAAISNFSSKAKSGDVFIYQHSSHGDSGLLCTYNAEYKKSELAADLRSFESGVKVIMVVDACYSGSLFKNRAARRAFLDNWDFAGEVSREMEAQQAEAVARGVKGADKALTAKEIGWVTAASDKETSIDFGYYDTDRWLTDPDYESGKAISGTFLGSATWGWWKGTGDTSSVGDKDGYCDPLEFWKVGYDFCTNLDTFWGIDPSDEYYPYSYHPQHTNDSVLRSVELGWGGDEEPGGVRFEPIPAQTATVGETLSYTLVATNTDGSTGAITYSVESSDAPSDSYSLSGANFAFTPPTDGSFSFNFLATNKTAHTSGKATMAVDASLAAPAGLASSGITDTSFTASWDAVQGASSYELDVATTATFDRGGSGDLVDEGFDKGTSLSDGWNVASGSLGGIYDSNGNYGKASPSLKLSNTVTLETPKLTRPDNISFWYKGNGSAFSSTLVVEQLVGGSWSEVASASISGSAATFTHALDPSATQVRFVFTKNSGNIALDDVLITGTAGDNTVVIDGQSVSGTSYTAEDLMTDTYYWRVRAVGNAEGAYSAVEEVILKSDPSAKPSIRPIDDIEIDVGETATVTVKVTAPAEALVTSIEITAGDAAAKLSDGVFSFAPEAPGTYDFTITALNANGDASESFAVVASLAEPETPETPTDVTSESFTAVWEGVPGAASYELVVVEGQGGSSGGGGGGGSGEILTETFADATYSTAGSGYANQSIGGKLGTWTATQCRGDQGNPTVGGTGTLASPEIAGGVSAVEFDYSWPFSETTSCDIDLYAGGNKVASANVTGGTAGTATYSFDAVSGATGIEFVNAHATAKKMRIRFDEIRITTAGTKSIAKAVGDVVFSNNVGNVTSYGVTGLRSSTEYTFAFRAVAENGETTDWSAPVTVKTDDGPSAPAWSAIPAQHAYLGATFQLDLSGYLSGSPTPAVTADTGSVSGLHFVYEPDATGPVTVTLTAVNDSGTDTVSFDLAVDEPPVGGNHYAVIVGCNKYDSEYIDSGSWLNGCVPDANHVQALVTSRGQWDAANVAKLTDSSAKHSAVLSAIASAASKAVPGDTFLYFHSSHGGNYTYTFVTNTALYTDWPIMVYSVDPEGVDNCVCTYDADFTAAELASALADFDPAVNIVVMIDACHSAGMFQYDDGTPVSQRAVRRNAAGKAMRPADPGLFAEAVGARIGAIRRARGIRAAANVAFVTAANFDEYSFDAQSGDGGEFTSAFIEGVTNGLCDGADYGDQDGWATFYEGWNYAKDIATGMPEGTEVDYDGHAVDANGYALYDNSYYAQEYGEPEYYYDYYFTHPQIDNESLLRVVRVGYAGDPSLDAPVAAEAANVTDSSFTASWSAVGDAAGYRLQVATDPSFSTGAASDTLVADDLAATSTTYTEFSGVAKDSGAVYAGKSATDKGAIQLNATTTTGAGIWTTASGGNVSRVAVEWNSATSSKPRSLLIYGSDSPLTSYAAVKAATSLGTIAHGSDTSLDIEGSYAYVGILASGGALYLDSVTIDWGTAGSESSVVFDQTVGPVTSLEVTGLEADTEYWYRVQALGDPVDSDFSNVIGLTTDASAPYAPVWDAIPPQTAAAGVALVVDLKPYVSGSPKPAITADAGTVENGVLTVSFAEAGSYTVNLTAENSEGSDTATLAVTVTDAPVTVPVLTLSNATDSTFDADWTACTGAETYQFQVATAPEFKAVRAGEAILSEDFAKCTKANGSEISSKLDTYTEAAGWTGVKVFEDDGRVKLGSSSATGSLVTPSVDIPAGAALSFKITKYGSDTGTVDVQLSANGSEFASLLDEVIAPVADGETYTVDFAEAVASAKVKFVTSSKRAYLDDVVLAGEGGGGGSGSTVILDTTTNGLSLTVTGLEPETTYYARVRMAGGEWSAVESIATTGEGPVGPAKYAVCVGLSEYDMAAFEALGLEVTPLKGCVNDATYLKKNLSERGGWAEADIALLTNGAATKAAIRGAIAAAAAKAKAGDTFVYEHSSHGLQGDEFDDYTAALATYENLYTDTELAEDLAAFADGVKVVVLIDACHSAGMIDDDDDDDDGGAGSASKARPAAAFDIARRVSALIDANRAVRKARGEDVSRTLTSDQIGWVTAAAYDETSKDGGYYDTDAWMSDDDAEGEERGGLFLASIAWGWWSGKADVTGDGDGDGWFDAYEGWSFSTPFCAELDQTPQYLHEDVLRSVELGWVGDTAPSEAILFDPVPGVSVGIGEEAVLDGIVARNPDGTTDGITLSIVDPSPEEADYAFADGKLTFTPDEDGLFLFTVRAVKGRTSATKILGVTAILPAPVAQEVADADIAEDGFTARWLGVDAARNYQLQVSTDPDFSMGEPDELVNEGFDDVTNKVASLPDDWTFSGTFGIYATGGEAPPSIKLSTDGATLTTPPFKLTSAENGLAFWTKGNPTGTDMTSTLTVQQLVGEEWQTLKDGTFVPSTDGETKEFESLDKAATRIRFVMAKTAGNIAIDDVVVAQSQGGVEVDEDEIPASETSYAVEDLEPGTTYYFRVRALANSRSAWSETIEVTTAGEKPLPVPDLTVMAPETSPDTSLAAFWVCTGAGEFRLQVATDEAFATLVYDETMTQIAMTVTGLLPETTYYVRVCALDGDRAGDWSNVESITTASSGPVPPPSEAAITGMTIADGQMTITFAGEGAQVLFSTDLVDWTPVEGATSPYTFDMGDGPGYIGVR